MNRRISSEEILKVLDYEPWVGGQGGVTTLDLSRHFGITESAMRRKLRKLEAENKIYGIAPYRVGRGKPAFLWHKTVNGKVP